MTPKNAFILVLSLGLLWAVGDQWTKYLAVRDLTHLFSDEAGLFERLRLFYTTHDLRQMATAPAEVIPGFWNHVYVQNPAGAFGLLSGLPELPRRLIFTLVALLASVGILYMASKNYGRGMLPTQICLALVFGGAVGNLIDRIVHGYVIDFIDWYVTVGDGFCPWAAHGGRCSWPAFNLADVGIVVGVFGLFFLLNFGRATMDETGGGDGEDDKSETKQQAEAG